MARADPVHAAEVSASDCSPWGAAQQTRVFVLREYRQNGIGIDFAEFICLCGQSGGTVPNLVQFRAIKRAGGVLPSPFANRFGPSPKSRAMASDQPASVYTLADCRTLQQALDHQPRRGGSSGPKIT